MQERAGDNIYHRGLRHPGHVAPNLTPRRTELIDVLASTLFSMLMTAHTAAPPAARTTAEERETQPIDLPCESSRKPPSCAQSKGIWGESTRMQRRKP